MLTATDTHSQYGFRRNYVVRKCRGAQIQVTLTTTCFTVTSNMWVNPHYGTWLHVTILTPRILRWFLIFFGKCLHPVHVQLHDYEVRSLP
jgi:hypothetical protein